MKPMQKILVGCGVLVLLAIIGAVGLVVWISKQPTSGVVLGNQMEKYALDYIAQHHLLNPEEKIIAYYDETMAMDGTEAAILTQDRVIYHKKNGLTTSIPIRDIQDVRHRTETLIGDIIEVQSTSGDMMKIEIAPFNQGQSFVEALRSRWKATKDGAQ